MKKLLMVCISFGVGCTSGDLKAGTDNMSSLQTDRKLAQETLAWQPSPPPRALTMSENKMKSKSKTPISIWA